MKAWKWIHTSTCPDIEEYGGFNKLRKYCVQCLYYVWMDSSTDWCNYSHLNHIIRYENCKIRSLQQLCIKQIIENSVQFTQLPDKLKNHIQKLKDQ